MKDLIYRQQAVDEIAKMMPTLMSADGTHPADEEIFKAQEIFVDCIKTIENLPSAQPTLYGYKIEHLACIARVMEKEGVTADYAVRAFDDMSRMIKMIIEEAQQKVEEVLNG